MAGRHPAAWNEFRHWGPTDSRFDHHVPPAREHPDRGVMYLAYRPVAHLLTAAVAERHQDSGTLTAIDVNDPDDPYITIFETAAPLHVLDLDSGWITRAGGNQAVSSGRRDRAREWARAIYEQLTDIDGVLYKSSIWGPGRCLALWERAVRALPAHNHASRSYRDLRAPLRRVAHELNVPFIE